MTTKLFLNWLALATCSTLAILVLLWIAIAVRVLLYEANHIAWGLDVLIPVFTLVTLTGVVRAVMNWRLDVLALIIILLGLISIGGVFVLDHFNVLVQYDTWLARGMPERPF